MKKTVNLFGSIDGFDRLNVGWQNVGGRSISYGSQSPAVDDQSEWFQHVPGDLRLFVGDGGLTIYGWRCTVGGTPGTWVEIDISVTPGADSIVMLDTVVSLRTYAGTVSPDILFFCRGYLALGDGGEGFYRLDFDTVDPDDGVLTFQINSNPSGPKFKFQNVGNDSMFRAQRCGTAFPATPAYSFDPSGVVPWGLELERVTRLLSFVDFGNAAQRVYAGITFDPRASYTSNGSEQVCQRTEWQPFVLDGQGSLLQPVPGPGGGALIYRARAAGDTATVPNVLMAGGYIADSPTSCARFWTEALVSNQTTMVGVSNVGAHGTVPALAPGQGVIVRIGACRTDASGWWMSDYFAHVAAINEGDVQLDVPLHGLPGFDDGLNVVRTQGKHDLVIVDTYGYQDNLTIKNFRLVNIDLAGGFDRGTKIDCTFESGTFQINATGSRAMDVSYVGRAITKTSGSNGIILQGCHNTLIRKFIVDNLMSGGITQELNTDGTHVELFDVAWDTTGIPGNAIIGLGCSALETSTITCDHMILRGGYGHFDISPQVSIGWLDIIAGSQQEGAGVDAPISVGFSCDLSKVERLTYSSITEPAPRSYSGKRTKQYPVPYPTVGNTVTWVSPIAGLARQVRIKALGSLAHIATFVVKSSLGGSTDFLAALTAGQWVNLPGAQGIDLTLPNWYGLGRLEITTSTDGSAPPAGSQFVVDVDYFVPDPPYYLAGDPDGLITGDTSVPLTLVSDGPPTANSDFIGQLCLDTSSQRRAYYISVQTGTGASDWNEMVATPRPLYDGPFNASFVSIPWLAGAYRHLTIWLRVDGGSGAGVLTFLGLVGDTYSVNGQYMTTAVQTPFGDSAWPMHGIGATIVNCETQVSCDANSLKSFMTKALDNAGYQYFLAGACNDTVNPVTGIKITFGGATTGYLQVFGS